MNAREYLTFLYGDAPGWAVAMVAEPRLRNLGIYRTNDLDAMAEAIVAASESYDVYASVYTFDRPRRLAPYALPSDVLYLEVDEPAQAWRGVEPTLRIASSPGREHLYWRVDRMVDAPERRRLLAALVSNGEGDPKAKDLSRVLRPPGTWSHKRSSRVEVSGGSGELYSVADVIGDRTIPAPRVKGEDDDTDLEAWLAAHGIAAEPRSDELGVKFAVECPWADDHTTPGLAYVGNIDDGALWYACPHAHCADKHWREYHDHYAPEFGIGRRKVLYAGGRPVGKSRPRGILESAATKSEG